MKSSVHLDLSGPWSKDSKQMQYIVVLIEVATHFVFLIPVKNKTAKIIADVILSRYISFLGCPNNLHTDLGREFYNEVIKELCSSLHINHSFCAMDVHNFDMSYV